jgi:4'-phosphopantetheinyl transferase
MNVFWLEQTEADVPAESDWLSPSEALRLAGLRFPKRRADWRLGRWTAKRAVAACLGLPIHAENLALLEIRAAASGEPEVFLQRVPAAVSISLSHRAGVALCAVTPSSTALGCDLEIVEPRSDAFAADYFTVEEQALLSRTPASNRAVLLSLLWSAKESALKALHQGLRLDTRSVIVELDLRAKSSDSVPWIPLQVRHGNGSIFHGCWFVRGRLLRSLVAAAPSLHAIPIKLTANTNLNYCSDFPQIRGHSNHEPTNGQ